jgi:hypothetical protein
VSRPRFITLGWQVIEWIEHYLCHGPGDVQGEPIVLDDEFTEHILRAYELRPDGRRKIRRDFLSRPKGRAKSELAGMLCCAEALGPVRFDGWDAKRQPVGRPVTYPFVRCLATEEGQSGNTYDNVTVMLEHVLERFGDEFPRLDVGLTRTFVPGGGEIVPSTASNASKDGGKETFAVFDETHLYETPELHKMHATVRRNLTKRKVAEPWSMETSTMYRPGAKSVAEETHEYAKMVADGRMRDDSLLFDHREMPEDIDWDDDDQLREGLAFVYGPAADWMDLDRLIADIRDPQSEEADSRRYFGNQIVKSSAQAFDVPRWDELAKPKLIVPGNDLITVGFDGSKFEDATAFIGTHVETCHQFVIDIWEKGPHDGEDWEVPDAEVDAALERAFDTWKIWRVYADPPYWEDAIDRWVGRYGDKRIYAWWTHRTKQTAYALKAYATSQRGGLLSHDGRSDFRRHIANARRSDTKMLDDKGQRLWVIRKEHPNSTNRIDAAMAGTLSHEARGDALAAGALRKKRRKKPAQLVSF